MTIKHRLRRIILKILEQIDMPGVKHPGLDLGLSNTNRSEITSDFYIDEASKFEIEGTPGGVVFPRWMQIAHCEDKRTSMILLPGETVKLPAKIKLEKDGL